MDRFGLLADGFQSNPLLDFGTGLLAASAPTTQPNTLGGSIGQAAQFAAQRGQQRNQAQTQQIKNEALREELRQKKRQREAQQQLLGQFQEAQNAPTQQIGQGQGAFTQQGLLDQQQPLNPNSPETLGLLAQASPETVFGADGLLSQQLTGGGNELQQEVSQLEGLLGRKLTENEKLQAAGVNRSPTSLERNVQLLNDPRLTDEQRDVVKNNLIKDSPNENVQAQVDLISSQLELQRQRQELQNEQQNQREQKISAKQSIERDINRAERLIDLNEDLRGTSLEAGVTLPEARRAAASGVSDLQQLLGVSNDKAQGLVDKFDKFQKEATVFAANSANRLFSGNNLTNFQLETVQKASPSISVTPDANRSIIAEQLQTLLDGADSAGLSIENREKARNLLKQLRGEDDQESSQTDNQNRDSRSNITVSRIQRMGQEQLSNLDSSRLTDAQLKAAAQRFDELSQ